MMKSTARVFCISIDGHYLSYLLICFMQPRVCQYYLVSLAKILLLLTIYAVWIDTQMYSLFCKRPQTKLILFAKTSFLFVFHWMKEELFTFQDVFFSLWVFYSHWFLREKSSYFFLHLGRMMKNNNKIFKFEISIHIHFDIDNAFCKQL